MCRNAVSILFSRPKLSTCINAFPFTLLLPHMSTTAVFMYFIIPWLSTRAVHLQSVSLTLTLVLIPTHALCLLSCYNLQPKWLWQTACLPQAGESPFSQLCTISTLSQKYLLAAEACSHNLHKNIHVQKLEINRMCKRSSMNTTTVITHIHIFTPRLTHTNKLPNTWSQHRDTNLSSPDFLVRHHTLTDSR